MHSDLEAVIAPPERCPEPADGDERSVTLGWLAFHRSALLAKCAGLTREQLATRSAPPSPMSLLGLLRHLTEMEHAYLDYGLGGGEFSLVYCTDDDPEADFEGVDGADPVVDVAVWRRACARSDELIAVAASFDEPGEGNGRSVRWNVLKVVGEYARHNGHADLVRERIDGATGE